MRYFWHCSWTNGKGGFNPDYEGCGMKSRATFKTPQACAEAAVAHANKHAWGKWGTPDTNWRDHLTRVYSKQGKTIKDMGVAADLLPARPPS